MNKESAAYEHAKELHRHLDDCLFAITILKQEVEHLRKISTPVYDHYKPFKDVEVGNKFAFGKRIYEKHEIINMVGNNVNALDTESNQYEYINDYDWVVELD